MRSPSSVQLSSAADELDLVRAALVDADATECAPNGLLCAGARRSRRLGRSHALGRAEFEFSSAELSSCELLQTDELEASSTKRRKRRRDVARARAATLAPMRLDCVERRR